MFVVTRRFDFIFLKNILYINRTVEEVAQQFGASVDDIRGVLAKAKTVLFEARRQRPKPHLDDKIITGWNGMRSADTNGVE